MDIRLVMFDYGGVLAEEGFYDGLMAMAKAHGREPQSFFEAVRDAVFDSGYLYGRGDEAGFWRLALERVGPLDGDPLAWRQDILSRFTLRPWMLEVVRSVRGSGRATAILSDQVDWLDMLNERDHFFGYFDAVFNSYHCGWTKREPEFFRLALERMGQAAEHTLFIDDAPHNVALARSLGIHAILYQGRDGVLAQLAQHLPDLAGVFSRLASGASAR